jgi:hypothetical protein
LLKFSLAQSAGAVGARLTKAAGRLDQHVDSLKGRIRVFAPVVVDECLFLLQIPVMQNVSHNRHVGFGKGIGEKIARLKTDAIRQPEAADVFFEDRAGRLKIEAERREMAMGCAITAVRPPWAQPISAKTGRRRTERRRRWLSPR